MSHTNFINHNPTKPKRTHSNRIMDLNLFISGHVIRPPEEEPTDVKLNSRTLEMKQTRVIQFKCVCNYLKGGLLILWKHDFFYQNKQHRTDKNWQDRLALEPCLMADKKNIHRPISSLVTLFFLRLNKFHIYRTTWASFHQYGLIKYHHR